MVLSGSAQVLGSNTDAEDKEMMEWKAMVTVPSKSPWGTKLYLLRIGHLQSNVH